MFSLRHSSKQSNKPVFSKAIGASGYRQCDEPVVCAFQAAVEREVDCDYDALRAALAWARSDRNHVVTMTNLRREYNTVIYASVQFATSRGN